MTERMSGYRNRTGAVRAAARDHLRKLRDDRRAKRTGPDRSGGEPAAPGTGPLPPGCDDPFAPSRPAIAVSAAAAGALTAGPVHANGSPPNSALLADNATDEIGGAHPELASASDIQMAERATGPMASLAPAQRDEPSRASPGTDDPSGERGEVEGARVPGEDPRPDTIASPEVAESDGLPVSLGAPAPRDDRLGADREAGTASVTAAAVGTGACTRRPGRSDAENSDLSELPGAGEGLVWILQQCGIRSLEDLAAADPAELSGRMGLIGDLLDMETWVAFARESAGRASESGPDKFIDE